MTPNPSHLAVSQWVLNLGVVATLGSYVLISREMLPCFRDLYQGLGYALPIPTLILFHPGAVRLSALLMFLACLALNLAFNRKKHLLLPGLSLVLTLSACLIAALVLAVLLPVMKHPQVL